MTKVSTKTVAKLLVERATEENKLGTNAPIVADAAEIEAILRLYHQVVLDLVKEGSIVSLGRLGSVGLRMYGKIVIASVRRSAELQQSRQFAKQEKTVNLEGLSSV